MTLTQRVLLDVDLLAHSADDEIVLLGGNVLLCSHPEENVQWKHNRSVDASVGLWCVILILQTIFKLSSRPIWFSMVQYGSWWRRQRVVMDGGHLLQKSN